MALRADFGQRAAVSCDRHALMSRPRLSVLDESSMGSPA